MKPAAEPREDDRSQLMGSGILTSRNRFDALLSGAAEIALPEPGWDPLKHDAVMQEAVLLDAWIDGVRSTAWLC